MPKHDNEHPKYAPLPPIPDMGDRRWPARDISESPIWCSVDLRDGNQALPNPMNPDQKLEYFNLLSWIGFRDIEVAFPSGSQDDFNIVRRLIEEDHIADDVFIMVLTQCRAHLIERTLESIRGAERAIVHIYIPTSDLHMRQVLGLSPEETIETAVRAVKQVREGAESRPEADIRLQFSPEEFTDTDLPFSLEICEAVFSEWGRATPDKPVILNLPATVERRPPNEYADMIEWFSRRFSERDRATISVHCHNDQGTAIAATELALQAGADRVEGTLFGHGERTGNVDIVTVANNLRVRGVDPGLDFSNLPEVAATVERLTGLPVYARQPYGGEYVFTAFAGSHQDAIGKVMRKRSEAGEKGARWKVPYLHIDPTDLGRRFERLIRITSQSGKGGVVWVLEQEHGLELPKAMQPEVREAVKKFCESTGREATSRDVYQIFLDEFVHPEGPFELVGYWPRPDDTDPATIHGEVRVKIDGEEHTATGDGNGPVSAFVHAIRQLAPEHFVLEDYHEQAVGRGEDAAAMAYVPIKLDNGEVVFGVGTDTNIDQAAVKAIVAGLNRIARRGNDDK